MHDHFDLLLIDTARAMHSACSGEASANFSDTQIFRLVAIAGFYLMAAPAAPMQDADDIIQAPRSIAAKRASRGSLLTSSATRKSASIGVPGIYTCF